MPHTSGQHTAGEAKSSLVFLNRFYWPDHGATAQMLTDLAEDLAASGCAVTVVTGRATYDGARAELAADETRNGVRILRVWSPSLGRARPLARLLGYASYYIGAFLRLLTLPRPHAIVAMTDPPLLLGAAVVAAKLRRCRAVLWSQDLYPQVAVRLGAFAPGGLLDRGFSALSRVLNRAADAVVALGPRMRDELIACGARPERTVLCPNWADASAIRPVHTRDNTFVKEHGLDGRFVVLYSGNAGRSHTFDAVLRAARELRSDADVLFLFIGGGHRKRDIRREATAHGLDNVRFLGYQPRERLHESLSAASLSLVTQDPPMDGLLVPSKTYGILASGRPVLFIGSEQSDVAAIVRDAGCGFVAAPDDAAAVVRAIRSLKDHPAEAERLGAAARRAAVQRYDRRLATSRWSDAVLPLINASVPHTAVADPTAAVV